MDERPGFEVPVATATLVIDEGPYAGAEIETRLSLSSGVYFGFKQWADVFDNPKTGEERLTAGRELATLFARYGLLSWNLQRAGEPIPATLESLLYEDLSLVAAIVRTWFGSIGTVPVPLPAARRNGRAATATPTTRRSGSTAGGRTAGSRRRKSTAKT